MGTRDDVLVRIDEIEAELRGLFAELHDLRALVGRAAELPVAEATLAPVAPPAAAAPAPRPPTPVSTPHLSAAKRRETAIFSARILLSDGRPHDALGELERAIVAARASGDRDGLERLGAELQGIARYRPRIRDRALALAEVARTTPTDVGAAPIAHPPIAHVAPAHRPAAPAAPPGPPRRGVVDLARDWELLGPRGFAIVGGAVTALGIILLFVLATNRGWITPTMRVAIGAVVSAVAVGIGFWVRKRYGQMQMSLGAVGAGIAGGYASLAAAAARYDLVPDWLALPLAGVIAAVAVVIAIAWSSETVAAIGLVGAALAPALQAIDTGMTWPSAAFAVIVLAATATLTVPRSWHQLLVAIAAVVTAQVAWLAYASDRSADAGTTAVVAALVLVVLAGGIWLQLASGKTDLEPLATSALLAAVGLALLFVPRLYEADRDLGLALAGAAVVWAVAWAALFRLQPALGLVLGVSALTLAAVASADLLSGTGLAVMWAAESVLLSALAWRLHDARLQATALVYGVLAGMHVFVLDAPPDTIFSDPVAGVAAVAVSALALAALVAGLLAPAETVPRTETGLLSWLAVVRTELTAHRDSLRDWLVFGGAAIGTYATALALVAISFRPGHLAATIVAAAVGVGVTAVSSRRGSPELAAASLAWLAGVLAVAAAFDVPEFAVEAVHRSYGGWALIAAAAGLLAGGFAFQLLSPDPGSPVVPGIAGVAALVSSAVGIALLSPQGEVLESSWIGWRLLAPAVVYVALSASVFRSTRHRDLATVMWALGTIALLGSEWLLVRDPIWRTVAFAVTAAVVAALERPLLEERLWLAGWMLALGTALTTLAALAVLWISDGAEPARFAIAPLSVTAALAVVSALAWGTGARRDLVTGAWAAAIVTLVFGEAFLLGGGPPTAFAAALTGGGVALLTTPLREERLWWAGAVVVSVTSAAVLVLLTPPTHFLTASASPGEGLWVAIGCLLAGSALHLSGPAYRSWTDPIVAVGALYVLSLAILELAERAFSGSVQTDFERGHVMVSSFWALIGLALLVAGLIRDQRWVRFGGLALFGLSIAKIFLYDLSTLSSVARALSFIAVGALVLAGGFFLQKLSSHMGPRRPHTP